MLVFTFEVFEKYPPAWHIVAFSKDSWSNKPIASTTLWNYNFHFYSPVTNSVTEKPQHQQRTVWFVCVWRQRDATGGQDSPRAYRHHSLPTVSVCSNRTNRGSARGVYRVLKMLLLRKEKQETGWKMASSFQVRREERSRIGLLLLCTVSTSRSNVTCNFVRLLQLFFYLIVDLFTLFVSCFVILFERTIGNCTPVDAAVTNINVVPQGSAGGALPPLLDKLIFQSINQLFSPEKISTDTQVVQRP